ncbi:MAG: Ig-like domain-containing protein, partial [Treponemataceae bacterium]|nr:Ig-like domain-containing protein [Treponemataceae bacterium]
NVTTLALAPGAKEKVTATVLPENADDKTVVWSSSDLAVATVGEDGTVTARVEGTATITAHAGGKTATCAVTVNKITEKPEPVAVESVTLNATTLTLEPGKTMTLTATVSDDGTVTAVSIGEASITAQAGDKEATCTVTVKQILIAVENVTLNEMTLTLMRGDTGKLTATVTPDNADDKTMLWSSSNASVATVGNDGTVTAHKAGEAKITAQAGDIKAECTITVNPILVESVTLDKETLALTRGDTERLTATVTPSNADDTTVTWSSSDQSVATVGEDGTVTAVSKGTATITAQAGGKTATCEVTVNPIPVENVTLNVTTLKLAPNMTKTLTATVNPDDADDKTVTWSSSDTSVATVSNDGMVTAVKVGAATITAQAGGKTAACEVTVHAHRIQGGNTCTECGIVLEDFEIDSDSVLTKYKGNAATVDIPDGVTSIGIGAFYECASLASVDIPGSVTSIGGSAFADCNSLKNVTMGEGVQTIDEYAFSDCYYLVSVTIPASVTSIKSQAFKACMHLESVTYGGTLAQWCALDECYGLNTLMSFAKHVTMGDGTDLKQVTTLTIPSGVERIGYAVFYECASLASVDIPGSVTSIGGYAFERCTNLTSVEIPNSVTSIWWYAFDGCTSLVSVT